MIEVQPKSPRNSKLIRIIGAIGLLAVSAIVWRYGSLSTWDLERRSLRANYIIENYREYEGDRVVIRGIGKLIRMQTLVACVPDYCGCNRAWGDFFVGDILVEEVECSGNQCNLFCSPFDPVEGNEYLIMGTVITRSYNNQPGKPGLSLINVDIEKSRMFKNGSWVYLK